MPKCVFWQTVMKCRIMRHFIRSTLFAIRQTLSSEKEILFYLEIITCDPWIYTTDHPKSSKVYCIKSEGRIHWINKSIIFYSLVHKGLNKIREHFKTLIFLRLKFHSLVKHFNLSLVPLYFSCKQLIFLYNMLDIYLQ